MNSDYLMLREENICCPLHVNPELEVVYVKSGNLTVGFENGTLNVNTGEAVIILPYHLHEFIPSESADVTVFMFSFSLAEEIYKTYGTKKYIIPKITVNETERDYINLCLSTGKKDIFRIRSLYFMFISDYLTHNTTELESNMDTKTVSKIIEYIYAHLEEPLTLEDTAKALNINRTTICKIFKDYVGISFHRFLQNIRLEKAKTLLLSKGLNVTEIAFECGFGSCRSFNRVFLEQIGCTPTDYRNKK